MSTITEAPVARADDARGRGKFLTRGRWIDHWEPEDEQFWETTGKKIARKNLVFSIFAENLGFSIWVLWTIVVINLGNVGITLSLLRAVLADGGAEPVGSTLRIPYTFAVPRFGGRAVDGDQRLAAADPGAAAGDRGAERLARRPEPRHPVLGAARLRGDGGLRRRQLLLVDGEHLVLLPGGQEGLRARAQRRGRQPRRRDRPAARAAGDHRRRAGGGGEAARCTRCTSPTRA